MYLENCRTEVEELKKMLKLEEKLANEEKFLKDDEKSLEIVRKNLENLNILTDMILEKQNYTINSSLLEIEQEELKIQKIEYEHESNFFKKQSSELQIKIMQYDTKIFEMKSILQLLSKITPGTIDIFKQEISKIVLKHDANPKKNNKLKIIMSLYLWLNNSYVKSTGKFLLRMKISFYLLRIRASLLNSEFSVAPVQFSTPEDCM